MPSTCLEDRQTCERVEEVHGDRTREGPTSLGHFVAAFAFVIASLLTEGSSAKAPSSQETKEEQRALEVRREYFPGTTVVQRTKEFDYVRGTLRLRKMTEFWRNGRIRCVKDMRAGTYELFSENSDQRLYRYALLPGGKRERVMFDREGHPFGNYYYERRKRPKLLVKQYLRELRTKIDDERLPILIGKLCKYSPDIDNRGRPNDVRQTAPEMARHVEEKDPSGQMLGDCEDFVSLLKELQPDMHLLHIAHHALGFKIIEKNDGLYSATVYDTFLARLTHTNAQFGLDIVSQKRGYASPEEAFYEAMRPYFEERGEEDFDPERIQIYETKKGRWVRKVVTLQSLVRKEETAPHE